VPWVEATLRGKRVLARAKGDRSLVVEAGRVEVRYRADDGRAYRAYAGNVLVIPGGKLLGDDACRPAESATTKAARPQRVERGPSAAHAGWVAYTDGACSGNPGPAGAGVVIVSPDGKTHEGFEYLGEATNNIAELTAILRALEWAPPGARALIVHTDSLYAIGVLQKGWKAKANPDLVSRTKKAVEANGARLVYVPGHQGVTLNERADALAREAVETRKTQTVVAREAEVRGSG
jgi:ribonuclease HI